MGNTPSHSNTTQVTSTPFPGATRNVAAGIITSSTTTNNNHTGSTIFEHTNLTKILKEEQALRTKRDVAHNNLNPYDSAHNKFSNVNVF